MRRLGDDQFTIKLTSSDEVDLHRERYFVLSHVWGDIDIACRTKCENFERYQNEGIDYNALPQTFQDVIRITVAVGVEYLWIDSLCIIQDDTSDWQRESAKMASIFRSASLTIAAASARNSLGGCNLSKIFEPATQFSGNSDGLLDFAIRGPEYKDAMRTLQDQMNGSPLNGRAWVFQEQILSPRSLHAAHSQFVWQCAAHIESEDGLHFEDHRRGRKVPWRTFDRHSDRSQPSGQAEERSASHSYELDQRWWFWVDKFMERTLKFTKDQYGACAGVVRLYQEISENEPVVGLWRRDLALHVAWYAFRDEYDHKEPLPEYGSRRPSWTWMTYPHGSVQIRGPRLEWEALEHGPAPQDLGVVYMATALGTDFTWSGEPLTSEPSGTITIRGICTTLPRPESHRHGFRERQIYLDPDLPPSIQAQDTFYTIALVSYVRSGYLITSPPSHVTFYLVIEPAGPDENNSYVRIGSMRIWRALPAITKSEFEPQGTYKDIVLV